MRAQEPKAAEPAVSDEPMSAWPANRDEAATKLNDHFVLVGHGRVGARVRAELLERGLPFLVGEDGPSAVRELTGLGVETFAGGGGEKALLDQINLKGARCLISAISDAFEAGNIIEQAKASNPQICVIARANSQEAVDDLRGLGAQVIVFSDEAIARMIDDGLAGCGKTGARATRRPAPPAAPAGLGGG